MCWNNLNHFNLQKVNAKNAFSVDIDCLNNIQEFLKMQNNDKKWVRTGEAIDAGAKVYGFRVDNIHNDAYRMLNGMCRNAIGQELEIIGEEQEEDKNVDDQAEVKKKFHKITYKNTQGERTLEKEHNLNISIFDT